MKGVRKEKNWGNRPWTFDFFPCEHALPEEVDFAVIGGGFTGLAAAAQLKRFSSDSSVALFEAGEFGAGSSGHTGGIVLAESAAGNLPGLGDVLAGYQKILGEIGVEGEVWLPGAYELGRTSPLPAAPIHWMDSGKLSVVRAVPGGTINPGKVVSGLARAAERAGVLFFEQCAVNDAKFAEYVHLHTRRGTFRAKKVLFATNAYSHELTGLQKRARSTFTLALATEQLSDGTIAEIGLSERKPFYTVDLPYLWGRLLGNAIIFGSGLVPLDNWRELASLDINRGEPARMFARLEIRVRGLHPGLSKVSFTNRWGGPICIADAWEPVFEWHSKSQKAIVLGAFAGHGVAQSVYLGSWAAEVLLGRRPLPKWGD